ncbi:hypothetical protein AAG570_003180 [Ranatra chinensis]|uniref:Uncharacterized protein n=1 Tax=Ranatra chinensis TaxID=642074 RepID=A0ABD0Y864_9HEMI
MMEMCKSIENVADRICLQQAVALIRHYEARMEALESSMSTMNQETTTVGGRIIATVLPFTDPGTERQPEKGRGGKAEIADCLQESGIFEEEEHTVELVTQSTQTYFTETPPGDLSQEIRKRLETLEGRLRVYESSGDAQTKQLAARIEKETRLAAEVGRLKDRIARLEQENRHLEEERCELEEAENDTRLRCQK